MSVHRQVGRRVDGILLLDKPLRLSSNQALQRARRLFGALKAGHTGSLDPLATGLLPVCFGEATKASAYLLEGDKRYRVTARLGRQTSTGDAEGEILREAQVPHLDADRIQQSLSRFVGEISQYPPMHSALKHQGKRLYELARAGLEVPRAARQIQIYAITLRSFSKDSLDLDIHCSKGTYIRVLIQDLAVDLGTCGHVESLRRLSAGPFHAEGMRSLAQLEAIAEQDGQAALDRVLLPIESAFLDWPKVELDADSAWYLSRGQAVQVAHVPTHGRLCVFGPNHSLMGIGEVLEDGRIAPRRLLQAVTVESP